MTSADLPFHNFPGYLLRIASHSNMTELGERIKVFDVTVVEATALIIIWKNEGCLQRFVAQSLNIASANLTPLLSRLEKKGFIKREPIDGRSNGLFLTDVGASSVKNAWATMKDYEEELLNRIPKHLQNGFLEALTYLSK